MICRNRNYIVKLIILRGVEKLADTNQKSSSRKSSNSEKNFVDAGQQHLFEPVEEKKGQEWQHEVNMYLFLLKM